VDKSKRWENDCGFIQKQFYNKFAGHVNTATEIRKQGSILQIVHTFMYGTLLAPLVCKLSKKIV